ncbi:MAG: L,D-transpeptidase family protein [Chlorobi bacterium]|nr:L,D-transpeptidase family protein [Chlorobiota bacterium]
MRFLTGAASKAIICLLFLVLVPFSAIRAESVAVNQGKVGTTAVKSSVAASAISELLRCHFEDPALSAGSGTAASKSFKSQLGRFYAVRQYIPVWTDQRMIVELLQAVEDARDDGLNPDDYHIGRLRRLYGNPSRTPAEQVGDDLLLTDAFLTLAYHLRFGKVDPESMDPDWNLDVSVRRKAIEYRLQQAITAGRIREALDELRPRHPEYTQLKKGLALYRSIAKAGGWQRIPEGASFREGTTDSRVPLLRKRLRASGDLSSALVDTSNVYSAAMVGAVKRFQKRNGLEVDGIAGPATVHELNIPAADRVDQIRLNLERYRWFIGDIASTHVLVNIPAFTLQYVENGRIRWATRVIVGQPYRKTPVFKADMQYIVFNPQWVIPPTILAKDALPAIRRNRSYLDKKRLQVIDSNGRAVNPASINWSQYTGSNFPYRLQQSAGDHGALGRIKFMMPNKHIIYLHDTPTKDLFEKSSRTFSSGCIRVENPLELAEFVLQDSAKWSRSAIESAIASGKTSTVWLPRRIPVFLLYLTAVAEGDSVLFRQDVYSRDSRLLNALDKPVPEYKIESCRL